ncbi:MAG: tRNA lysidine(34) synthetase TilS [Solirubrobacteraceae bacterium]
MSAAEAITSGVREEGLLVPAGPVVVMLSGGRDSTCLLDIAVQVCGAAAVTALHVNYGLRASADDDERHCGELCARLGVELEVKHVRTRAPGNVQAWARELRYDAAARLALSHAADIAAGHTATDQVEGVLYRLASSPSRRALLGMRSRDGNLVRPLLHITRDQTGAYCRERSLSWRDDESNDSDAYVRGRVRRTLVPALREIHPAAEQNVLAVIETLRAEAEVLDGLVEAELAGRTEIELRRLRMLPVALARLIVQRLADGVAGRPTPGASRRLDDILALRDGGSNHIDLRGGVRASVVDGVLSLDRTPEIAHDP